MKAYGVWSCVLRQYLVRALRYQFSFRTAGSTGDPGAAQLIIDNRAVALDYARNDQTPFGTGAQPQGGRERGGDSRAPKTDWLCDTVRSVKMKIFCAHI